MYVILIISNDTETLYGPYETKEIVNIYLETYLNEVKNIYKNCQIIPINNLIGCEENYVIRCPLNASWQFISQIKIFKCVNPV